MIRVDFLRHGETDAAGRLLGRTDAPLTPAGRRAIAGQVAGRTWAAIVASPLVRASESAEIAAARCGQSVALDADWREMDFGDWDGASLDRLAGEARFAAFQRDPGAQPPPNGEATGAVAARVTAALERLAACETGPVLVVAHGGTIRMALAILLGLPLDRVWAIRIGCATRVGVELGRHAAHGLWGQIVEIAQPAPERDEDA